MHSIMAIYTNSDAIFKDTIGKSVEVSNSTLAAKNKWRSFPIILIGKVVRKMPIGKEEWKSGNKYATFEERILSFLKRNQDSAFTLSEIVTGLGYSIEIGDVGTFVSGVAGYWLFQNAIENLVKQGTVEARKIKLPTGEQIYYRTT